MDPAWMMPCLPLTKAVTFCEENKKVIFCFFSAPYVTFWCIFGFWLCRHRARRAGRGIYVRKHSRRLPPFITHQRQIEGSLLIRIYHLIQIEAKLVNARVTDEGDIKLTMTLRDHVIYVTSFAIAGSVNSGSLSTSLANKGWIFDWSDDGLNSNLLILLFYILILQHKIGSFMK